MSKKDVTHVRPLNGSTPKFIEHNDESLFIAASVLWGGPSYPQPLSILEQTMKIALFGASHQEPTLDIDHEVVEDLQLPPAPCSEQDKK